MVQSVDPTAGKCGVREVARGPEVKGDDKGDGPTGVGGRGVG